MDLAVFVQYLKHEMQVMGISIRPDETIELGANTFVSYSTRFVCSPYFTLLAISLIDFAVSAAAIYVCMSNPACGLLPDILLQQFYDYILTLHIGIKLIRFSRWSYTNFATQLCRAESYSDSSVDSVSAEPQGKKKRLISV
jgi:hypothetical protein